MKIKISLEEYECLKSMGCNVIEDFSLVEGKNHYVGEIANDIADQVRDKCGDELQLDGFDEDYEPTKKGKILESLVDKFFTG